MFSCPGTSWRVLGKAAGAVWLSLHLSFKGAFSNIGLWQMSFKYWEVPCTEFTLHTVHCTTVHNVCVEVLWWWWILKNMICDARVNCTIYVKFTIHNNAITACNRYIDFNSQYKNYGVIQDFCSLEQPFFNNWLTDWPVSYTHLRAHET